MPLSGGDVRHDGDSGDRFGSLRSRINPRVREAVSVALDHIIKMMDRSGERLLRSFSRLQSVSCVPPDNLLNLDGRRCRRLCVGDGGDARFYADPAARGGAMPVPDSTLAVDGRRPRRPTH